MLLDSRSLSVSYRSLSAACDCARAAAVLLSWIGLVFLSISSVHVCKSFLQCTEHVSYTNTMGPFFMGVHYVVV